MKNLFKSLMLVAVAAMAFTACSQDNNEVNKLTKKTSIDFIASIGDDTRSGFGDKVGDKYVSKWDGLEDIIAVAHTDSGDVVAYTTIDEEGKGEFTAEFETNDVITRVDFYTPSYSWMTWEEIVANLPQTQTPRANSVDPSAHILRGSIEVVNNEAQGHVNFKHEFAYGKMTLNLPEDFKVETVNLAFNGVDEEYQKLELSADHVENNVFWFTTIPMNVATFTVEATAKNGAIATKEVTVDKAGDLVFEQGHVSTFSVSNLDISLYDYEVILTKVIAINGNTISFEGENPQDRAIIEFNTGLASIVAGTYSGVDASYGPGYSSNDALEFNYNGSTFNSSESYNSSYDMYFGSNDIVISDLGGDAIRVETVQETWVSALNKSCRFRIFFEGALDIEAPAAPAFTSAYVYDYGSGYSDYYLIFEDSVLGNLTLNAYYLTNSDWTINAGVYGFSTGYGCFYNGQYSTYNDVMLYGGSVEVAVVDGQYVFTFVNLANSDGQVVLENATFTGVPSGLVVPDYRTKLDKPIATATAEGNIITISWDAVAGAVAYKVFCATTGAIEPVETTEMSVTIEAAYNSSYEFYVTAIADANDPDYQSSDVCIVNVTTEKDPNAPFAEYIASDLYWNADGYFVFVVDHYEIFRVKMNDADCPNHTTILEGEYTGVASSTVGTGKFSVYQKVVGGYTEGWTSTKTTSTMSVSYVDGQYVIIVNYDSAWGGSGEVGYKGIPEGWDVPGSGDSGDDNTGGEGGDDNTGEDDDADGVTNVTWSYYIDSSNSGTYGHIWTVSSGDDAFFAYVTMDAREGYSSSTSFTPGTFNYHAQYADGNYGAGMWFTMRNIKIAGVEYSNYDVDGSITVTKDGGTYTLTMELYRMINGYRTDKLATIVGTI